MSIRQAIITDLDIVKKIAEACAIDMANYSIFQWNEKYPSRDVFKNDIEAGALYVLEINKKIVGCIMLSDVKDDSYKDVKWLTKDFKNLYVHRLAVDPDYQKKGHGRKLMDFAESFAVANNFTSIRLDTFSLNHRNNKFYKSRGYTQLGDVFFPIQSDLPFHCYEKVLL
ncbi:MAG: GNAT family N-acetyltransferase [Pelagibacterales bacterium]|nr:GNAT family N-acetyltransferase [Pelagibacterales bacterium]